MDSELASYLTIIFIFMCLYVYSFGYEGFLIYLIVLFGSGVAFILLYFFYKWVGLP